MILAVRLFGIALIGVAGVSVGWRFLSRRYKLPCPAYLANLVDAPNADFMGSTRNTLDRIGIQPGERLLDVGAGPGRISRPAALRTGSSGIVVALDVQPHMLERLKARAAKANIPNIEAKVADISRDQSLPEASFDRAWMVAVLGEVPDREAAIRNIFRVLKPGGTFSITETMRDPHYQRNKTVLQLCSDAGFVPTQYWGTVWEYTQSFVKP
ncbi:MAG: class I SAM-dependent methyltransferase [Anaerolinea sp.]|nr:class I SAM-dependent methyltransferase [Anaerolinea sp.]